MPYGMKSSMLFTDMHGCCDLMAVQSAVLGDILDKQLRLAFAKVSAAAQNTEVHGIDVQGEAYGSSAALLA